MSTRCSWYYWHISLPLTMGFHGAWNLVILGVTLFHPVARVVCLFKGHQWFEVTDAFHCARCEKETPN